jgi:SAM-dependent methyltransferase
MIRTLAKLTLGTLGLLPTARRARETIGSATRWLRYRVDSVRFRAAAAGLPIPPMGLNFSVTGKTDVEWYVKGGWLAAQSIRFALDRNGIVLDQSAAILDFGCGSGRVIRYWRKEPVTMYGTDYNPALVRWCERHLSFAKFEVNRDVPPLGYPRDFFDLIYALSVFTHLDEARQFAWMDELWRIAKPGRYVVITTHGDCPFYRRLLSDTEVARFRCGELVVQARGEAGSNSLNAYHPVQYVRSRLTRGFAVVSYLEGGAFGNPHQDLYLLQKLEAKPR